MLVCPQPFEVRIWHWIWCKFHWLFSNKNLRVFTMFYIDCKPSLLCSKIHSKGCQISNVQVWHGSVEWKSCKLASEDKWKEKVQWFRTTFLMLHGQVLSITPHPFQEISIMNYSMSKKLVLQKNWNSNQPWVSEFFNVHVFAYNFPLESTIKEPSKVLG